MNIVQQILPESKWDLKCPYSMNPDGITVHNTANDASAQNEISYMSGNSSSTSFHYAVDDIQAIQAIPESRNGWHAGDGDGFGNRRTIGIEICYSMSGGSRFIQAEKNAVTLIVGILKRYGWGVDKVGTHQMRSGKYCPHRTLDMGWQRFIDMVSAELNPNPNRPVPTPVKMEIPCKFTANFDGVQVWDLTTNPFYKGVKSLAKGEEFNAYGYIPFNGIVYYVTQYSFSKGLKNGVNQNDLTQYVAPPVVEPPKPIEPPIVITPPTPPEPVVVPVEPKPEPVITPEPIEPTEPPKRSWLLLILDWITSILKALSKKG